MIEGRVFVGTSGAEYGRRCFVSAYDAATGRELWRFYNIPTPEQGGWWGKWVERDAFGTPLRRNIKREHADREKEKGDASVHCDVLIRREKGVLPKKEIV